jgi:hypothetical protein
LYYIIEEPSGPIVNEDGGLRVQDGRAGNKEGVRPRMRKSGLKQVLVVHPQKASEVLRRMQCSEPSSDVTVSVQQISLQVPVSIRATNGEGIRTVVG